MCRWLKTNHYSSERYKEKKDLSLQVPGESFTQIRGRTALITPQRPQLEFGAYIFVMMSTTFAKKRPFSSCFLLARNHVAAYFQLLMKTMKGSVIKTTWVRVGMLLVAACSIWLMVGGIGRDFDDHQLYTGDDKSGHDRLAGHPWFPKGWDIKGNV